MSHRPPFNPHHIFKSDNTPRGWNLTEQPHGPHLTGGAPESGSIVLPANNVTVCGNFPPRWIPAPVYPSSVHNIELPHHLPMPPCPSPYPFPQHSADGNLHMLQENYSHNNYSSGISRQMNFGTDVASYHQTSGHGRGSYKRKRSGFYDMGSTGRCYEVGRSSGSQIPTTLWQEKPSAESYHGNLGYPQSHGANNLAITSDCLRNVRSRTALDLDHNPSRSHFSNNSRSHHFLNEQSNPVDAWAQSSTSSTREYVYHTIPPSNNAYIAQSDSSYYSRETSTITMSNNNHGSLEIQGYNNIYSMRNPAFPPTVNSHLNYPVGGVRIGNCQTSAHPFRASSAIFSQGHVLPSGEHFIPGPCYPSRDPWPHNTLRFRDVERNQGTPRYRSPAEANFYYRFTPESVDAMVHAGFYGSGAMFDQHRDMRLDIDDMTYEELLELEERIGSVSTGLSDILISKCLTDSIHCKSNPTEDERTCVICLEEYEDKDNVGKLTECGHDFHVGCIRKWLSLKNSCPICKANAFVGK